MHLSTRNNPASSLAYQFIYINPLRQWVDEYTFTSDPHRLGVAQKRTRLKSCEAFVSRILRALTYLRVLNPNMVDTKLIIFWFSCSKMRNSIFKFKL